MMPGELRLKPPPTLWLPVSLLVAGAVFLLVTRSETASQVLALILVAMATALVRHWKGLSGAALVLLDNGCWLHPREQVPLTLTGTSVRLLGVFWLHGVDEVGLSRHLMVLPGMLAEEDYRRLCVWYEHAGAKRGSGGTE